MILAGLGQEEDQIFKQRQQKELSYRWEFKLKFVVSVS